MNDFWVDICKEPIFRILGIQSAALILCPSSLKLLQLLIFNARRCILLQWISDSVPTVTHWIQSVMEFILLEAKSFWLKEKPFHFFGIWDPFLDYIVDEGAQALRNGLYGLAWSDIPRYIST